MSSGLGQMNIYIIVSIARASQRAIGAFSSNEKANGYIAEQNIQDAEISLFELPSDTREMPEMVHIAHKSGGAGLYTISGYFLKKFEATLARGEGGYVKTLSVDDPDPEAIEERLPEERTRASAERAQLHPPEAIDTESGAGGRRNVMFLIATLSILTIVNVLYYLRSPRFELAENVSSVAWLPSEANDISYLFTEKVRVFEFTISESGFMTWLVGEGLTATKLENSNMKIPRYTFDADIPIEGLENESEEEQFEIWESFTKATISDGFAFNTEAPDESSTVMGGYDLPKKRAYYRQKFH